MRYSTEGPGVGLALGKFDSSDSNERFWQMFTNAKGYYNSDRLSYLTSKTFFEYVTILGGKLKFFFIHRNKSDFSTFKT